MGKGWVKGGSDKSEELHAGHIVIVEMKALAQSHVWWPGIGREIEHVTSRCEGCRAVKQDPKLTTVHTWVGAPADEYMSILLGQWTNGPISISGGCVLEVTRSFGNGGDINRPVAG